MWTNDQILRVASGKPHAPPRRAPNQVAEFQPWCAPQAGVPNAISCGTKPGKTPSTHRLGV